ncbi:MAG TPA: shikimate dehydrogenase [Acidimicrobiales bacterium]|jgi:shikimate dehydrogenase
MGANPGAGWPGAGTQVAAVIGSPVRHSLSPVVHNAAFAAAGLDWVYLAFDVDEAGVGAALTGARALGIRGLSVTMPLKASVAAAVDRLTPEAASLGAVNTALLGPHGWVGDNTDGPGFLAALREAGWAPDGRRCVVVGAGGAARAVVHALAGAGAADVAVVNRSEPRARAAAALARGVGRIGTTADVAAADLVVNATPVGMAGTPDEGRLSVEPTHLRPGLVVVDLVYHPVRTPLLRAAAERGATAVDGVGMLVGQAALQFSAWTGAIAPLAAMADAARAALDGRRRA